MATLYRVDGSTAVVLPVDGRRFTLAELQGLVGGLIEVRNLLDDSSLVLDEEGKLKGKEVNPAATALTSAFFQRHDFLVGDVLHLDIEETLTALQDPDDDDDADEDDEPEDDGYAEQLSCQAAAGFDD